MTNVGVHGWVMVRAVKGLANIITISLKKYKHRKTKNTKVQISGRVMPADLGLKDLTISGRNGSH